MIFITFAVGSRKWNTDRRLEAVRKHSLW